MDVIVRNQDIKKLETTCFGLTLAIFRKLPDTPDGPWRPLDNTLHTTYAPHLHTRQPGG